MDVQRIRPILRTIAGVCITALLTACVLYWLLLRLGDANGAWWVARFGAFAVVASLSALTALCLTGDHLSHSDADAETVIR